jgi:hypothetical protein
MPEGLLHPFFMSFIAGLIPPDVYPGSAPEPGAGPGAPSFSNSSVSPVSAKNPGRVWLRREPGELQGVELRIYFFVGIAEFLATCFGDATLTAVAVLSPLAVLV